MDKGMDIGIHIIVGVHRLLAVLVIYANRVTILGKQMLTCVQLMPHLAHKIQTV